MIKETNTELIDFLLSLIKNAPVGIISIDMYGYITLANQVAATHLDLDINKCLNQHILDIYEKRSRFYRHIEKCLMEGRENFSIERISAGGKYLKVNGSVVLNGMLIITHDITDQVQREREIIDKNQKLKIYNDQLQHIAFALSHNLRSPIASMLGLVNICRKEFTENGNGDYIDNEKMQIIDMIDDSAKKMDDVIKSMNEVMSIQNEKVKKEWLDLNEHFDMVLRQIKPRLERNGINVQKNFEQEPKVYAKKEYIDEILMNLINNAIYYRSSKRKCNINVSSARYSNYSVIQVKDNGVGLNMKKDQEKIFRIYQPPGFHSENFELGYYIVKAQVEQMQGKLQIQSKEERGTTLTISLPRR